MPTLAPTEAAWLLITSRTWRWRRTSSLQTHQTPHVGQHNHNLWWNPLHEVIPPGEGGQHVCLSNLLLYFVHELSSWSLLSTLSGNKTHSHKTKPHLNVKPVKPAYIDWTLLTFHPCTTWQARAPQATPIFTRTINLSWVKAWGPKRDILGVPPKSISY